MHTPLQGLVAALQLLVLTGVFEDVQVDVAVVVGAFLHAQACIRHAELVADARYPFGGSLQLAGHPLGFHGGGVAMVVHLQQVEGVLALVVVAVVGIHRVQSHPKRVERLSIAAVLVQIAADFDVGTHRLIHILILGELLQGLLSQVQGEQRVGRLAQQVEGMPAMFAEVVVIFGRRHQPGQALQAAAFEIGEIFPQGHPPRGEELVEVTQLLRLVPLSLHQRSRSADVVGMQPLGGVGHRLVGHPTDVLQRLGPLLQVIIVAGRHDVELRTGIAEPPALVPLGKEGIVLGNAVHAPQGAVAVVVEFLVEGRPLVDAHQADVGHEELQLVLCQLVDGAVQLFGLLEIHLHEGAEGQVVASLGLARPIEAHRLEGTAGRHPRRVKVAIAPGIGRPVERVDPLHFALRRPAGTRSQCQPCAQQARPTAVHPSLPVHRFLPVLHENKATNKTVKNRRLPARKNVYYHSDGKAAVFREEKEGFSSFPSAPSHFYTISLGEISKKCLPLQKFNK
ncbi:unknown [Bacteroides sp. CAG:661]|nr:unknown [Bacteroides sp. CAG:661]